MKPQALLQALMDRDGDNPHSLAAKLKGNPSQPQIYKFLKAIAREPRRSTLQPLADHYGVPIEAFYEDEVAQKYLEQLANAAGHHAGEPASTYAAAAAALERHPIQVSQEQLLLLQDLEDIPPARRSVLLEQIHQAAEEAREAAAHFAARQGKQQQPAAGETTSPGFALSAEERARVAALRHGSSPPSSKRGSG